MTHFLGTHQNRLDAKGRVSIPASFRAALRGDGEVAGAIQAAAIPMVLRPSHIHPCIEGWPVAAFQALAAPLEAMDVFSPEHDDLAATLYCDAYPMEADREGRIVLPDLLVRHAGLSEAVVFMGLGRTFQIWEPAAAERRRLEARDRAREKGLTLSPRGGGVLGSAAQQVSGTPTR
jgi:MraZ protein